MFGVPIIDCLYSLEFLPAGSSHDAASIQREMDRSAISYALLTPCRRWSCEKHWGSDGVWLTEMNVVVKAAPARFGGLVGYSPFSIPESLALLELALEKGYRGAWVQTEGAEIGIADSKMYPLYSECWRLGRPVVVQVGVSMAKIASV